ncbi:hypothetical protein Tco_0979412 [Tanacetum coccineum]
MFFLAVGSYPPRPSHDTKAVEVDVSIGTSIALVSCDGLGGYDWSDQAEEGLNYALMAFSSSSSNSEVSNDSICSKSCLETVELLKSQNDQLLKDLKKSKLMVLVPPPYTGNFMPPTPDLSFTGLDEFVNKHVVENYDEEEDVSRLKIEKKIVRPSIVKKEFYGKLEVYSGLFRGLERLMVVECLEKEAVKACVLLDVVFDGAFGGVGDEEVVIETTVVVISSSLDKMTNRCLRRDYYEVLDFS